MKYRNMFKKFSAPLMAAGSAFMASTAMAIDTTAIGTAVTAAQTDALTVGEMVIAAVAALVVIGLVIAIVRKL